MILFQVSNSTNIIKVQLGWKISLKVLKTVVKCYFKDKSKLTEASIITWNKVITSITFISSLYLVGVLWLNNLTKYSSTN